MIVLPARTSRLLDAVELRHLVLRSVDRAIGAEAELARSREAAARLQAALARTTERHQRLIAERDGLAAQLAAIHRSQTWRVGQAVVRPAARIARRAKVVRARTGGRR